VTLLDMQRVLTRILTDKAFRLSFMLGEEPRPTTYDLTERELRSLRGLRWERVGLHSELLAHSRLELALKPLALTSLLLREQLHEHLDRFCAEYPPVPAAASQMILDANRIGDFATRLLGEGVLQPIWAADVISYERILLTLARTAEAAVSAEQVAALNETDWPPADDLVPAAVPAVVAAAVPAVVAAAVPAVVAAAVPVTGPHVVIASFGCPLPDLIPLLEAGQVPASVPPLEQPLLLLFHKVPRGPVQMVKINAAAAALVEACDGCRTVADVVDELSHRFGDGIGPQAIAALRWLRDNGIVGLRKGA
jgi:hypothetical protein